MLNYHDYGYAIDAKTLSAHRLECDVPHHMFAAGSSVMFRAGPLKGTWRAIDLEWRQPDRYGVLRGQLILTPAGWRRGSVWLGRYLVLQTGADRWERPKNATEARKCQLLGFSTMAVAAWLQLSREEQKQTAVQAAAVYDAMDAQAHHALINAEEACGEALRARLREVRSAKGRRQHHDSEIRVPLGKWQRPNASAANTRSVGSLGQEAVSSRELTRLSLRVAAKAASANPRTGRPPRH